MSMAGLDDQLRALESMTKVELSDRWATLTDRPVPKVSPSMLRLALAYELQAKARGGLSRKARQQLAQSAANVAKDIRPGMRLAREFGGTVHVVIIGDQNE